MNKKNKYHLQKKWLYIILGCMVADQASKMLIQINLLPHSSINIIPNFLSFSYIDNPGIAFGLDPFNSPLILLLISVVAIFFIFKILFNSLEESKLVQFSLSLIIGGALGNFVDRFFSTFEIMNYSGVIDFIEIGIGKYKFPYIFNLADSFITVGIILYFISFIKIRFYNDK